MYYNRFDIANAYYVFLSNYHEGQNSGKYARLCKLLRVYNPGLTVQSGGFETENAKEIYNNLVDKEKQQNLKDRHRNTRKKK